MIAEQYGDNKSIWAYAQSPGLALHMKSKGFLKLLVILAGDTEINPGPRVTCSTCVKEIKRNQLKAKCKTYGVCFHPKCTKENFGEDIYCRLCYICPEENEYTNNDCYDKLRSLTINRGLKILHQNVNGLLSKIDAIRLLCGSQNKHIHVFGVTESKLDSAISDAEVQIQGYNGVRYDRKNGSGGWSVRIHS